MPFLIGTPDDAIGIDRDPVGGTESRSNDLRSGAIGGDLDQRAVLRMDRQLGVACRLQVIDVPVGPLLQTTGRFVEMRRVHRIDIERLVVIGLAIAIEISQAGDLISAQHQDLFLSWLATGQ